MTASETIPDYLTRHDKSDHTLVGKTVTVKCAREQAYAFWRTLSNVATFAESIERVEEIDAKRSHWVARAPEGGLEWDAHLVEEDANRLLAWQTEEGSDIRYAGRVEFRDAPPGRGCTVTLELTYHPPAGALGRLFAKVFDKDPRIQGARDLRRFKQLLETGEIPTTEPGPAAPRGA
jgi:uncharacterized membrane protein